MPERLSTSDQLRSTYFSQFDFPSLYSFQLIQTSWASPWTCIIGGPEPTAGNQIFTTFSLFVRFLSFFSLHLLFYLNLTAQLRYMWGQCHLGWWLTQSTVITGVMLSFINPWLFFRIVSCLMQLQCNEQVLLDSYYSPLLSQAWKSHEPWVGELQFAIPWSFRGSDPKIDPT